MTPALRKSADQATAARREATKLHEEEEFAATAQSGASPVSAEGVAAETEWAASDALDLPVKDLPVKFEAIPATVIPGAIYSEWGPWPERPWDENIHPWRQNDPFQEGPRRAFKYR